MTTRAAQRRRPADGILDGLLLVCLGVQVSRDPKKKAQALKSGGFEDQVELWNVISRHAVVRSPVADGYPSVEGAGHFLSFPCDHAVAFFGQMLYF